MTGASSGLGLAFARLLAADGHDLVLSARSEDKLSRIARDLQDEFSVSARVVALDLAVQGAADELLAEAGAVDVLINNAGFGDFAALTEADWQKLQSMITLNVETLTRRKLDNVVDAIRDGADLEIPAEDALRVTALTEAAYRSDETGERVAVRDLLSDGVGE